MRKVLLDEAMEVRKLVREKYKQGFLDYYSWGIQMMPDAFIKTFPKFIVESRDREDYPWKISTEYNGVEFFAIIDKREAAEYGIQI